MAGPDHAALGLASRPSVSGSVASALAGHLRPLLRLLAVALCQGPILPAGPDAADVRVGGSTTGDGLGAMGMA